MVDKTETATLLDELLDDAKRVAAYGQRTGRLRDPQLISAIAAVERLPERTWAAPEIVMLQSSINAALQAISPTNLADLRGSWNPYQSNATGKQFLFVVATLLLMMVTALTTFEYNRGVTLLKGVESLQKDDPRAEIGAIIRQLLAVNDAAAEQAIPQTEAALDEPHFALIDRLHEIDGRVGFYLRQMGDFRTGHQLPQEMLASAAADVQKLVGGMFGAAQAAGDTPGTAATDPAGLPASGVDACAKRGAATEQYVSGFASTPVAGVLTRYLASVLDIVCAENIAYPPTSIPSYAAFIHDVGTWSNIWGLWYLPALYGALGAMLYYMRRILDPTIPDPPAIRILHRTALGAFAGVIIAWFWAPNAELNQSVSSIGLTLFTLAFLVGFGIEVLFALLDRMVGVLIDVAKGVGERPPPSPPAPSAH